jgi:Flp pilus assembly protein TadD
LQPSVGRVISACWPLALGVLFVATFRTPERVSATDAGAARCDSVGRSDVASLERCLALDAENAELMTDLGDQYRKAGNVSGAETLYRRALAVDSHDGDVHLRLGEVLLARGDAAGAAAEGEAALAVQPGSAAAQRLVARAGGSR